MTVRPSLVRSIPFWILLVGSIATGAFGAWLATDRLSVMTTGLTDNTATAADVYVGQVWAIIGGILIATGIVGLALALVLAVLRSFVPVPDVEIIEALDWSADDEAYADTAADSESVVVTDREPLHEPAAQR